MIKPKFKSPIYIKNFLFLFHYCTILNKKVFFSLSEHDTHYIYDS